MLLFGCRYPPLLGASAAALKTPEPIHLKFGKFDYVYCPTWHVAAENTGWGGHKGEVVPSRAFSSFLLVTSMRLQLTLWSMGFRSMQPKRVLVEGVCVPLGSRLAVCPEGQILPFYLRRKTFLNGLTKAIIFFMGVNGKRPLWLMVAP